MAGVYILENTPLLGGGYQQIPFEEKYEKGKKKEEYVREKGRKGKEGKKKKWEVKGSNKCKKGKN